MTFQCSGIFTYESVVPVNWNRCSLSIVPRFILLTLMSDVKLQTYLLTSNQSVENEMIELSRFFVLFVALFTLNSIVQCDAQARLLTLPPFPSWFAFTSVR